MDKKNIEFHIASNDYFGTLATTLDLLRQAVEKRGYRKNDLRLLENLKAELMYLQERMIIRHRP